jgi:hypothetical protein
MHNTFSKHNHKHKKSSLLNEILLQTACSKTMHKLKSLQKDMKGALKVNVTHLYKLFHIKCPHNNANSSLKTDTQTSQSQQLINTMKYQYPT